jgi:hypothetical protein
MVTDKKALRNGTQELPRRGAIQGVVEAQSRSRPTCYTVLRGLHGSAAYRRLLSLLGLGWRFNEALPHSASTVQRWVCKRGNKRMYSPQIPQNAQIEIIGFRPLRVGFT